MGGLECDPCCCIAGEEDAGRKQTETTTCTVACDQNESRNGKIEVNDSEINWLAIDRVAYFLFAWYWNVEHTSNAPHNKRFGERLRFHVCLLPAGCRLHFPFKPWLTHHAPSASYPHQSSRAGRRAAGC